MHNPLSIRDHKRVDTVLFLTYHETRLNREEASKERCTVENQDKDVPRFNFHEAWSKQQRPQI